MNESRRLGRLIVVLALGLALAGCASAPVVIDTTEVDGVILDVSDTAGTIETQTVTVYETVKEYIKDPAELAKVAAEFDKLNASIAHLKTLPAELASAHAVEVGKLSKEIARLQPFEVEVVKVKGQRNTAWAIIAGILALVAVAVFLKIKGLIF